MDELATADGILPLAPATSEDGGPLPHEVLEGVVVSQLANFFYVAVGEEEFACHLRGRFKKEGVTPYVGDRVVIHLEPPEPDEKLPPPRKGSLMLPERDGSRVVMRKGSIDEILPRRNLLKRPSIANVDQILLVFAADQPAFSPLLLDKFLILTQHQGYEPVIVINKRDLVPADELAGYVEAYASLGYQVVTTQGSVGGVDALLPLLANKTSVFAGPSGVGKSTLVNYLQPGLKLRTLEVSVKLQRGRHTTRHAALYPIDSAPGALLADTPGFSFLEIEAIDPRELAWYFPEMRPFIPNCKFPSCLHDQEPDCAVKAQNCLSDARYDSYMRFLDELLAMEKERSDRSIKEESSVKRQSGLAGKDTKLVKVDAADREGNRRSIKQKLSNFLPDEDEPDEDEELEGLWDDDEPGPA